MFDELITTAVSWASENPSWAGVIIFTISMAESLIVVGLFVPGILAMGAIGALVANGALPLWPTMLFAILGAICGDSFSYSIGRVYKGNLAKLWIFKKFPNWLSRSKTFFHSHGALSVVIGRFLGPVRPFIPAVAGIMSMCPRKFLIANIVSAICWAPLYMLPGYSLVKFT